MAEIIKADIPIVQALLKKVFSEDRYQEIERLGGLTNHTYRVKMPDGKQYVVRLPGEGTEEMIVRSDEKISTTLACRLGVDAALLYFGDDGSKVSEYIPDAITMSSALIGAPERIRQVAEVFRIMHQSGEDTGVSFDVFDLADGYWKIVRDKQVPLFDDFDETKRSVVAIKKEIDSIFSAPLVPCHNDPLCENWVVGNGRMYLIDWEYAGMNDGMWDLADVSIEASFNDEQDLLLLSEYLGHRPDRNDLLHFLASKIYVDFLWTLWAKARVPYDGQPMEDWAVERYTRLKGFLNEYNKIKGE